jgi:hypothetical protein
VARPQTDGGRIAPSSFFFGSEATRYGAKETDSSSFSSTDGGKLPRFTLHTSALFLIWNAAAAIAASHREEEEEEQTPKGSGQGETASTGRGTGRERERERGAAALLRRAARAAKAEKQAERQDTGWLDSFTQMGVAIYGQNNELLVPGQKQEDPAAVADGATATLMSEEDPATVAKRAAAMLMSEQTEPTSEPPTHT